MCVRQQEKKKQLRFSCCQLCHGGGGRESGTDGERLRKEVLRKKMTLNDSVLKRWITDWLRLLGGKQK